ncbi:MAG: PilZ domain-containing protein [Lachnospiraceae bacterium]|nr:PilZ domain-containing protein [Lachnospiraceae bacterium]
MQERRQYKRLPIELDLEIKKVYKQDYVVIEDVDAEISVFDISKSGIGFVSKAKLPIDFYFDGKIKLGDIDYFYAVIHIVRGEVNANGEGNAYGAEFVGLAPFLANKIDDYEKNMTLNKRRIGV